MATKREIEAYRKRLARIGGAINPGAQLTSECLYAVVTYLDEFGGEEKVGTLVGYSHRIGQGLFGPRVVTDITVCTDCAHRKGRCGPDFEVTATDVAVLEVVRNGDREAASR
jgi:hypothetical protein